MAGLIEGLPSGLRGDYAGLGADLTLAQDMAGYAPADHATWRSLYARQAALLPCHAAAAFREGLDRLPFAAGIPDFARCSALLRAATGWVLVAVPGLIPDAAFFGHLAARRFPVTRWIRRREELDYIVEPDVFHDAFGHVPLLTQPDFADFLQAYGAMGETAARIGALKPLARLYWHMVEFGLIREGRDPRLWRRHPLLRRRDAACDRGRCAAPAALRPAAGAAQRLPHRSVQPTYFGIGGYAELFATMPALPALLAEARDAAPIPPGAAAPGDQPL
ncbi:phenylalanine 4-monooxygenase [Paeniroseomonas aquatica]|uniref:phenylalanine 4-monooxygenase n=1 Tax=Paeniroseomonas aquatica TaxID=373043 RepID=UPI00361C0978